MTTPFPESLRSDLISLIQRGPKPLMERVNKTSVQGWQFDTDRQEGENGPYLDISLHYKGQLVGFIEAYVTESGEFETDLTSSMKTEAMDAEILNLFGQGVRQALILDNAHQADRLAFLNHVQAEIEPCVAMSAEDLGEKLTKIDAQTSHTGQSLTGLLISPSVVASFYMSHKTGRDVCGISFKATNPKDHEMVLDLGRAWTDFDEEGSFSVSDDADTELLHKMASLAIKAAMPMIEIKRDRPIEEKEAEIKSALEAGLGF